MKKKTKRGTSPNFRLRESARWISRNRDAFPEALVVYIDYLHGGATLQELIAKVPAFGLAGRKVEKT